MTSRTRRDRRGSLWHVPPGTFDFRSQYSIDGGPSTQFVPPTTYPQWLYRRPFFLSGDISSGAHTLVITNLGEQFWLDYIQVEADAEQGSTSTSGSLAGSPSKGTTSSTLKTSTTSARTKIAPGVSDNQPGSSSSSTQSAGCVTAGGNSPVSSTETSIVGPVPVVVSSPTNVASSPIVSPTSTPAGMGTRTAKAGLGTPVGSPIMEPGAIVGVSVAAVVLLLLVGFGTWWWRRRRRHSMESEIRAVPFGHRSVASLRIAREWGEREEGDVAPDLPALLDRAFIGGDDTGAYERVRWKRRGRTARDPHERSCHPGRRRYW
ncbi:hypothetical protein C8Q80DRAFT_217984 [Daedaleopsis nitida]|nr:hypothetical protein C8Q80DRAFT_217984 [Daedaleopsis nitida]